MPWPHTEDRQLIAVRNEQPAAQRVWSHASLSVIRLLYSGRDYILKYSSRIPAQSSSYSMEMDPGSGVCMSPSYFFVRFATN
jgi:hypothetical protein